MVTGVQTYPAVPGTAARALSSNIVLGETEVGGGSPSKRRASTITVFQWRSAGDAWRTRGGSQQYGAGRGQAGHGLTMTLGPTLITYADEEWKDHDQKHYDAHYHYDDDNSPRRLMLAAGGLGGGGG